MECSFFFFQGGGIVCVCVRACVCKSVRACARALQECGNECARGSVQVKCVVQERERVDGPVGFLVREVRSKNLPAVGVGRELVYQRLRCLARVDGDGPEEGGVEW